MQVPLDITDWKMIERPCQTDADRSVDGVGSVQVVQLKPPPSTLLDCLHDPQHKSFLEMWNRLPPHLRDFRFDLEGSDLSPVDAKQRGSLLLQHDCRLSKSKTDIGHCHRLTFKIELKSLAPPPSVLDVVELVLSLRSK